VPEKAELSDINVTSAEVWVIWRQMFETDFQCTLVTLLCIAEKTLKLVNNSNLLISKGLACREVKLIGGKKFSTYKLLLVYWVCSEI